MSAAAAAAAVAAAAVTTAATTAATSAATTAAVAAAGGCCRPVLELLQIRFANREYISGWTQLMNDCLLSGLKHRAIHLKVHCLCSVSGSRTGGQTGRWARAGLLCFMLQILILGKNAGKARISAHAAGKLVKELFSAC